MDFLGENGISLLRHLECSVWREVFPAFHEFTWWDVLRSTTNGITRRPQRKTRPSPLDPAQSEHTTYQTRNLSYFIFDSTFNFIIRRAASGLLTSWADELSDWLSISFRAGCLAVTTSRFWTDSRADHIPLKWVRGATFPLGKPSKNMWSISYTSCVRLRGVAFRDRAGFVLYL